MKNLRHGVFWPPFLLVLAAGIVSFTNKDAFISITTKANDWLLINLGGLFSLSGLLLLITVVVVYFSPLGKVKLGGKDAKPMLTLPNWIAIALTTTVAAGVTFWGIVEPIYHYLTPPESMNITPGSHEAIIYSMSTMYLHWTITPYAIYCVPALMFAFAYYNMKKSFSLSSTMAPLFGTKIEGRWGQVIDAVCLYTLALGMAAAMGTTVINLGGGVNYLSGIASAPALWAVITVVLMTTFIISAASGLMNGIRILSDINMKVYIVIILFIFIVGPSSFIINLGVESYGNYITNFFEKSLFTGAASGDQWPQWWTVFYWANWFAWAAITALFLGRIAYGYSVRTFIVVNFAIPSLFGGLWMTIFGGTTIHRLITDTKIADIFTTEGPETALYAILADVPLSAVVIPFYLFIVFLSFVTAADSNISAMGGISSSGITPDSPEPSIVIKVTWGVAIAVIAWMMISFAKIDGIKMLSNLGGLPAMILCVLIAISLLKVASNPRKYDKTDQ
ncbi:BCCT family transporter [Sporosarcina sp. FSL K6-1522]|uniref:BCCT family transporter n=1 Tax=Sporosarcina sp. FSL K6-1522 TaxID=2921554 RepID=UPI00315B3093